MTNSLPSRSTATVIVKAAPRVGDTHGETVCCAGIDPGGHWVRLYPVIFRTLEDAQKFGRWDVIQYDWRLPKGDKRTESRRIEHSSLSIVGHTKDVRARENLIAPLVVRSLEETAQEGKSFAFIRPVHPRFLVEAKDKAQYEADREKFVLWHKQEAEGLFGYLAKDLVPYEPAPYNFKYQYETPEGRREGTCQDWEVEATFLKWRRLYGERKALDLMQEKFGEEYPKKGFVLAMGTHKAYGNWLINGIVRLDHGAEHRLQGSLF